MLECLVYTKTSGCMFIIQTYFQTSLSSKSPTYQFGVIFRTERLVQGRDAQTIRGPTKTRKAPGTLSFRSCDYLFIASQDCLSLCALVQKI